MSPLTKAFVVLTTLLSVIMVSLTVAVVARVENHKAKYATMESDRRVALQEAAVLRGTESDSAASNQETESEAQKTADALRGQLAAKDGQVSGHIATIASLQLGFDRMTAANDTLSKTIDSANARIAVQDDTINNQIERLAGLASEKAQVDRTLVNAIADRNRYENEVRLLNERLRAAQTTMGEMQNKIDVFVQHIDRTGEDAEEILEGGIKIAGSVTNVDQIGDSMTLVEVNVGTRDGVQEGMSFTVFRGDQYLGTIGITTVDTDMAVGEVTLMVNPIRANDSVKTGD